jgi:hypothetical protein
VGFNAMQVHESGLETGGAGENDAQHNTLSKVQADFRLRKLSGCSLD